MVEWREVLKISRLKLSKANLKDGLPFYYFYQKTTYLKIRYCGLLEPQ